MTSEDIGAVVAIYLRGDHLQPHHISEVLGIQPSWCQRKGDLCNGSNTVVAKIGVWALVAQTHSKFIVDHIAELLDQLSAMQTPVVTINGVTEAYLDVFIPLDDGLRNSRAIELRLSNIHVHELNRLGLSVHFSVM